MSINNLDNENFQGTYGIFGLLNKERLLFAFVIVLIEFI